MTNDDLYDAGQRLGAPVRRRMNKAALQESIMGNVALARSNRAQLFAKARAVGVPGRYTKPVSQLRREVRARYRTILESEPIDMLRRRAANYDVEGYLDLARGDLVEALFGIYDTYDSTFSLFGTVTDWIGGE